MHKNIVALSYYRELSYSQMKTNSGIMVYLTIAILFFITGCGTSEATVWMRSNLDSCVGKLTTTDVLMFASTPYQEKTISDGQIWIYRYGATNSSSTTTGTGGLLNPYQTENKTYDRFFDIILRLNKDSVLVQWSYGGNATPVWNSDAPISFQRIPFTHHHCPENNIDKQ
jgi:hypothetical protein